MVRARPFHDIKVWGGRFNDGKKKLCSTDTLCHYYNCMIINGRLCHITWSRKWHSLPPQTLMNRVWSMSRMWVLVTVNLAIWTLGICVCACRTLLHSLQEGKVPTFRHWQLHTMYYGMSAGYSPLCLSRCLWGIWASMVGWAEISESAMKQAQRPVPGTFHHIMVFMICTMSMWICRMCMWILDNG